MKRSPRLTTATSVPFMRKPRTWPSANSPTAPTRCILSRGDPGAPWSATLFNPRVVFERHEHAQTALRPVARNVADAGEVLDQGQNARLDDQLLPVSGLNLALPGNRRDHLTPRADM